MSDDLISREALKKEFDDKCAYECAICKYAKDFAPCKLIDNAPTVERPQGERAERALAIIDRLRTDGYINNKEQGTLRRAILLPERSQGVWIKHIRSIECSVCKNKFFADDEDENCQDYEPCTDLRFNFCPNCGADMRGGRE